MLVFVTSLRHPWNSDDYARVERLLQRTLISVCRQRDREFRAIVVGNQPPAFELPDQAEFVTVEFAPPSTERGPRSGREAVLADKGTKLAVGMLAARRHSPHHAMVIDADDLVSNRLAAFVNRDPDANGWYVRQGFAYTAPGLLRRLEDFHTHCGTSIILKWDLLDIPDLPLTSTQDELREGFGSFTVRELLGSHRVAVDHFAGQGSPLTPLPFPGAIYVVGTGENHSGEQLDGFAWPVRKHIADEFAAPRSTMDPRALRELPRRASRTVRRRASRAVRRPLRLI